MVVVRCLLSIFSSALSGVLSAHQEQRIIAMKYSETKDGEDTNMF